MADRRFVNFLALYAVGLAFAAYLVCVTIPAKLMRDAQAAEPIPVASLIETRYCGPPRRNAAGDIVRSSAVRAAFQREHPCPATGGRSKPCPGWQIDHVIPLACGGCDAVSNMQWLPVELKTGKGWLPKDRWERHIYGGHVAFTSCKEPAIP